jgi:gluconokinase
MTFLVVDVGSSSVRTLLYDATATPIVGAVVQRPYQFEMQHGGAVVDPLELAERVEQCIDEILKHPQATHIEAVGMATFVGNVMGINTHYRPTTPLYTYADKRAADDVKVLSSELDSHTVYQRTGCRVHSAYHPARFAWLKRTQSSIWQETARWMDIGAFLYLRWLNQVACSISVASWSGLLNRHTLEWDTDWLDWLGLSVQQLPELYQSNTAFSGLQSHYAQRWQALRDVPFFLAWGDGACANVGSGATQDQQLALTIGTTSALRQTTVSPPAQLASGLWCYRVDDSLVIMGGATNEGGNVFQWAKETLKLDFATVENQLQDKPIASHGLTILPLFAGERSPYWAENATATLHGITFTTTPLDILQALMQSVAIRLSIIAETLNIHDAEIFVGGGALAKSNVWTEMVCHALNCRLHVIAESETTARGVVLLMLKSLRKTPLSNFPPIILKTFEPNSEKVLLYQQLRESGKELYEKIYG